MPSTIDWNHERHGAVEQPELAFAQAASVQLVAQLGWPGGTVGSIGATVSVSASVQPGQGYYIKVLAAGGPGPIGGYGLLVNFGSQPQAAMTPPNTVVAQQPSQAGGTSNDNAPPPNPLAGLLEDLGLQNVIGTLTGWVETMSIAPDVVGSVAAGLLTQTSSTVAALEAVAISIAGNTASTSNSDTAQSSNNNTSTSSAPGGAGPASTLLRAVDQSINDLNSIL